MMNGFDEEPALANFNYYKPFLTGDSGDAQLGKELEGVIAKYLEYAEDEDWENDEAAEDDAE